MWTIKTKIEILILQCFIQCKDFYKYYGFVPFPTIERGHSYRDHMIVEFTPAEP